MGFCAAAVVDVSTWLVAPKFEMNIKLIETSRAHESHTNKMSSSSFRWRAHRTERRNTSKKAHIMNFFRSAARIERTNCNFHCTHTHTLETKCAAVFRAREYYTLKWQTGVNEIVEREKSPSNNSWGYGFLAGSNCKWPLSSKFNFVMSARAVFSPLELVVCRTVIAERGFYSSLRANEWHRVVLGVDSKSQQLLNALHVIISNANGWSWACVCLWVSSPNFTQLRTIWENK